ncbi:MAG: hypothetical protein EOP04_01875 [Proteobacteria bacterium]|nr:MAG: hypothetical protein EOP04_01875 [Pseudomonadota bacterium]
MSSDEKNKMNIPFLLMAITVILLSIALLISNLHHSDRSKREAEARESARESAREAREEAKILREQGLRNLAADNLHEYLNCKYEQAVCDRLFPDASETVRKAKEGPEKGTPK